MCILATLRSSDFLALNFIHSGLLVAYLSLRRMEKKHGELPLFKYYFHRFWRCVLLVNNAAMGRAEFLIYPWFIFFFFILSVSRPKLLSARIRMTQLMMLNHATCDALICVNIFFSFFCFYRSVRFEENLNKLSIEGMHWHRSFNFRYVTNKIVLRLLITFLCAVHKIWWNHG